MADERFKAGRATRGRRKSTVTEGKLWPVADDDDTTYPANEFLDKYSPMQG